MKKDMITWLFAIVLITNISYAKEKDQFSSVPIIPASHPSVTLRQSAQKALVSLVSSQNADGSFGNANNRIMDTSLALIVLTRTPQLGPSHKKSIDSASEWIRRCAPESDAEKLAVIMALSGLYTGNRGKAGEENSLMKTDFSNIDKLLREVDGKIGGVWRDALSLTKLPDGVAKPNWVVNDNATRDKYRKQQAFPLDTLEDYLNGYLHAIVKLWDNDRNLETLATAVQSKQNRDGSLQTASTNNDIGAAALVVLYPTVYQKTAYLYFSDPVKEAK